MSKARTDLLPLEVLVETGYGRLSVPRSIFNLWQLYGWPPEHRLRRMVEARSVEVTDD